MSDETTKNPARPAKEPVKKGKRYQGYDVEAMRKDRSKRKKPWFWKILGISLVLTALLIMAACGYFFRSNQKMTAYISEINEANTMEKLLDNHKNVRIISRYSHLAEMDDYETSRYVSKNKKGDYYSFFKIKGTEEDYKEVIDKKKVYRLQGDFPFFYGLPADDYETICLKEIEDTVIQISDKKKIKEQKESGNFIKLDITYQVAEGDMYNTTYEFEVGDEILQSVTVDKETMIVMTSVESCNGEEFNSYTVEFDGKKMVPSFYKKIKKASEKRKCTVYFDYDEKDEKKYVFKVPVDVYFNLFPHEGYTVYSDRRCENEFGDYLAGLQNPTSELDLYVVKNEE